MTDADILESQPMDINDDDKPTEITIENGVSNEAPSTPSGKVIQVTNVSPGATLQQLATLFGFLGTVTDIRLYPSDEATQVQVKVCFIKYENNEHCGVAQHLTNTVFIDKALIVVPIQREEIPEEAQSQHLINSINAYAMLAETGYLPSGFPADETDGTIPGLPPPPVITCSTDPVEIEEIKRTIFVKDIDKSVTSEQLMAFFSGVGEVKYMRICNPTANRYALIEFSAPESVPTALQYNGVIFGGRCLKVAHAKCPIVKPESERIASGRNTTRPGRDVVRRPSSVNLRKSRSRSADRRRSRSRGRTSKGHSRSKAHSRSRSKSRKRRSRSRSPRRRSPIRSPPRRKSRSRSRSRPRRRTRSRSRSPVRRRRRSNSRSRSRERRRKKRSTSKSSSRSPRRRKKSRSKSRSPRRKSRKSLSKSPDRSKKRIRDDRKDKDKSKDKDKEKEKDKDQGKDKEKDKEKEKEKGKDRENNSPEKDLKTLLDKVYTYEEEKEKEKKKEKEKSSKEKELKKDD